MTVTLRMPCLLNRFSDFRELFGHIFHKAALQETYLNEMLGKTLFRAAISVDARYASLAMKPYILSKNSSDSGLP